MGYGNAKAIFEHEFNPWLTKSYKNLWFIKGWKVRMFWNWYPSSRSMIGWLMINGCVPQRLAQTVAWFKPCSCLFTKWGSLTAQSGLERSFLKASGTQCSATCQPSTPPRTFLPAFVQRYFQTPVSIQTFGGIIVPSLKFQPPARTIFTQVTAALRSSDAAVPQRHVVEPAGVGTTSCRE